MAIQSQPSRISEPFAGSGTKNVIPATNATPSASQAASWASGFPPECSQPISAGGCPVPRDDMNGVLNWLSQGFAFKQDGGVWEWSALADYDIGRIVRGSDGLLYQSKAQSGPGLTAGMQDPTADDGTYWQAPFAKTMPPLENSGAIATTKWAVDVFGSMTLYVDTANGNDANDGRSQSAALKTIGQAISLAGMYGTSKFKICLFAGTYSENVELSQQDVALELHGNATISGTFYVRNGSSVLLTDNGDGYALSVSTSSTGAVFGVIEQSLFVATVPLSIADASSAFVGIQVSNSSTAWFGSAASVNITATNLSHVAVLVYNGSSVMFGGNVTIGGTKASGGVYAERSSTILFYGGLTIGDMMSWGAAVRAGEGSSIAFQDTSVFLNGTNQQYANTVLASRGSVIYGINSTIQIYTKAAHQNAISASVSSTVMFETCTTSITFGSGADRGLYAEICGAIQFYSGSVSFSGTVGTATAAALTNSMIAMNGGVAVSGTVTGTRYLAQRGGQINVDGGGANVFPGSAAGSASATSYGYYA